MYITVPWKEPLLVWTLLGLCMSLLIWLDGVRWGRGSGGSSLMLLSSSHSHSSQQRPGGVSRRGLAQCLRGRGMLCGHSGIQPTTPSIQLHWCSQLGWKSSPCWYTRPANSHGRPWASAEAKTQQTSGTSLVIQSRAWDVATLCLLLISRHIKMIYQIISGLYCPFHSAITQIR